MTPKQKQRLHQQSTVLLHAAGWSADEHQEMTLREIASQIRSLAAEGPPRCRTCGYHVVDACTKRKFPAWHSQTVVPGDYGCVLHSDYEASDA